MARVKRAVHSRKRKKDYFKAAKGYRGGRGKLWRTVKDAVERSWEYSYRDRKVRKAIRDPSVRPDPQGLLALTAQRDRKVLLDP